MTTNRHRRWLVAAAAAAAPVLAGLPGCSQQPQLAKPEQIALLAGLRTACSIRSEQRLADVEGRIEAAHARGDLPDDAASAMLEIARTAHAGSWHAAEKRCRDMQAGQPRRTLW